MSNIDNPQPEVLDGHTYDGIQEYDNPMPGWWLWILWASVIWSPLYIAGVHWFDVIDTYQEDLAEGQTELAQIRDSWEEANPSFVVTDETLAGFDTAEAAERGAALFASNCAACHGDQGQGLIGPNLTDDYWVHGGSRVDIFRVISEGVLEKGMAPWETVLGVEQRAELVAFIRRLAPATNGKAPEGELYSEGSGT